MKQLIYIISVLLSALCCACIDDGITTAPSAQPLFAADTLDLGELYDCEPSPTHRITLRNPNSRGIILDRVALDNGLNWRINLDGTAGREFANVEIRANDSIFLFVEATFGTQPTDQPTRILDAVTVLCNGITSRLCLTAEVHNATRLRAHTILSDTVFAAGKPIVIYDSLTVAPGATLTLMPGTRLRFRDGAWLNVQGSLKSCGTPDQPVDMTGHRTGLAAANIPYDIMSGQWDGIYIAPESQGNELTHTVVRNSAGGVAVDSLAQLTVRSSVLRNSAGYVLSAVHAQIDLTATELAEGSNGIIYQRGGSLSMNHCTVANNYLFTVIGGPALQLVLPAEDDVTPAVQATLTNCIFGGLGAPFNFTDLEGTTVYLNRCLLPVPGSDDDHFIDCLWEADPLFLTVRADYHFDYRVRHDSPAANAAIPGAQPGLLDPHGQPLDPHIGAYAPVPQDYE